MIVVLDTTALVADYRLRTPAMRALIQRARNGYLLLVVPEVAVVEVVAKFRRECEEAVTVLARTRRKLDRLGVAPTDEAVPDPDKEAAVYEHELRSLLTADGSIAPLPEVPHAFLVERAVTRRKPFGETGTGYRDALIWETVLTLAASDRVGLVTNNWKDFATNSDDVAALVPDLAQDLRERGLPDDRLQVFRSPEALVTHEFERHERLLAELRAQPPVSAGQLVARLDPVVPISPRLASGLPAGVMVIGITDVEISEDEGPVDVLDARYVDASTAFVRLAVTVDAVIEFLLPWEDGSLGESGVINKVLRLVFHGTYDTSQGNLTHLLFVDAASP